MEFSKPASPLVLRRSRAAGMRYGALFRFWHAPDVPICPTNVGCSGNNGLSAHAVRSQFLAWLRENVRARKARRIGFSIVLSRQPSPAHLFFRLIEVETKVPFANSISAFSRSQDPKRTAPSLPHVRNSRVLYLTPRSNIQRPTWDAQ